MDIYLVERTDNGITWDSFTSFVCHADSETEARNMLPAEDVRFNGPDWIRLEDINSLKVTKQGTSLPGSISGVILFHNIGA